MLSEQAHNFHEILHKFKDLNWHELKVVDLTHVDFVTLMAVYCETQQREQNEDMPLINISSLSKQFHCSMPAISKRMNGLEDKALIERVSMKEDRRSVYIKLTEEGKQKVEAAMKKMNDFVEQVIEKYGEDESAQLFEQLNRFHDVMAEEMKNFREN